MTATTVGRYRIIRPIGSGGMGEVYLAEDPKLQRNVALKIVSDPDEKAKRRFVREAVTASQLSHPTWPWCTKRGRPRTAQRSSRCSTSKARRSAIA